MGFESINFYFIPQQDKIAGIKQVLLRHGATPATMRLSGENECFAIKKEEKFWIDILLSKESSQKLQYASIRIALCNPPDILYPLKDFVKDLLSECGGYLIETRTHMKFFSISSTEESDFEHIFIESQKEFQKYYAIFTAAISGENVFDYMRNNLNIKA